MKAPRLPEARHQLLPQLQPQYLRADILAGVVVFFVALPLCLGIAMASGAPLVSGLLGGVIGGLVVTLISRSQLSVSGPAAGLTLLVLNFVGVLGSYESFLVALVLAGLMQVAMGVFRAGILAAFVPHNVIKGMLAAIGIIIILKQLPHAVGWHSGLLGGEMEFFQINQETTISELLNALGAINPFAFSLTAFSLGIILFWPKPKRQASGFMHKLALVPGPLVAVLTTTAVSFLATHNNLDWALQPNQLVNDLPVFRSVAELKAALPAPNWEILYSINVWVAAATLAIVGSLETLLSVEAVDRIDPLHRSSPKNRELVAQGVGNTLSGLLGAMPLTAVIVRSATNVEAGGRTWVAAFVHGLLLLAATVAVPNLLNLIPKATLAAVLLIVGYKLAKLSLFREMYRKGPKQFMPFITTVVAIVFTDLLVGLGIGLAVGIAYILKANMEMPFEHIYFTRPTPTNAETKVDLRLTDKVAFLSKPAIQQVLRRLPDSAIVLIYGEHCRYIDADVREMLQDYAKTAHLRNQVVELKLPPEDTRWR